MKKLIIFMFILSLAVNTEAFIQIDQACYSQCTSNGYYFNYCYEKCSYDNQPQAERVFNLPDYSCLQQCAKDGNIYSICLQLCK